MSRKTKGAVPVVKMPAVSHNETAVTSANEGNTLQVEDTPAPANAEVPAAVPDENKTGLIVSIDAPAAKTFELIVVQHNAEGEETVRYGIKFSLAAAIAGKIDFIVGTAVDQLFRKMDMAKAFKTKLFDSRLPLELAIKTGDTTLDFGNIDQIFLQKVKVNNGERSKLGFIDKIIAISTSMLEEITATRSTTLREDVKIAIEHRYGKPSKGYISGTAVASMVKAEMPTPVMEITSSGDLVEA